MADIFGNQREKMQALYGENKRITGDYDKALAVKCVNGTFVGKKTDGVIVYKGIPFVGKQPVGELRWKATRKAPGRLRAMPLPFTFAAKTAFI